MGDAAYSDAHAAGSLLDESEAVQLALSIADGN